MLVDRPWIEDNNLLVSFVGLGSNDAALNRVNCTLLVILLVVIGNVIRVWRVWVRLVLVDGEGNLWGGWLPCESV